MLLFVMLLRKGFCTDWLSDLSTFNCKCLFDLFAACPNNAVNATFSFDRYRTCST